MKCESTTNSKPYGGLGISIGKALGVVLLAWPTLAQAPDPAREAQRAQELVTAGKLDEAIRIYQGLVRNSPA